MNSFFILLLLVSVVCFVIGLVKPSVVKMKSRKQSLLVFGISFFVLVILVSATTKKKEITPVAGTTTPQQEVEKSTTPSTPVAEKNDNNTVDTKVKTDPVVTAPVTKPTTTPTQTTRENILAILKSNASAKWGDNYQMVKYEYDNQVEAYDWVTAQTGYPEIMTKAKQKWGNNYQMVKYEYENQVEAFKSL